MNLKGYLRPAWKWSWLILAATLIAAGAAYWVSRDMPKVFMARATLMVGRTLNDPNPNANEFSLNQTLSAAYSTLATREPVAQAVMASLNLTELPQYKAAPTSNGQLIEITVTDNNPELCQAVANELARQVILQSPTGRVSNQAQQSFTDSQIADVQKKITNTQKAIDDKTASLGELTSAADIASLQTEIQALETRLSALQTNYANLLGTTQQGAANSLEIFEPAALPNKPIGPNIPLIILAAAAGGFLLAAGAAYLIEFLDNTFRDADEIAQAVPAPVIGHIGELEHERGGLLLTVADRPLTAAAEGFRSLRTNLEFMAVDRPFQTLVVTSAGAGDGKSSVALNLAIMIAQSDKRVIILDADLRRASLHRNLKIPNREGLSDLFRGRRLEDVIHPWKDERLQIITSGTTPPNPTELLSSRRMDEILASLRERADVVIIDSPPFFVPDAWVLASKMDGLLFVIRPGYTRRTAVRQAFEQIKRVNARVAGLAVNRIAQTRNLLYSSSSYMSYYYSVQVDPRTGEARSVETKGRGPGRWLGFPRLGKSAAPELPPAEVVPANGAAHTVHLEVLPPAAPAEPAAAAPASPLSLDKLYAISRELVSDLEPQELRQRVLRMSVESFNAASGSFIALDEQGTAVEGMIYYADHAITQDAAQLAEVVERGLAGWVIKHRRPAMLIDTQTDERWVRRAWGTAGNVGPRSAVAVPLLVDDQVLGVLTLAHAEVGHFTRDDLSALTAIAVGLASTVKVKAA